MPYARQTKRPERCCACRTADQTTLAARADVRGRLSVVSRLCTPCAQAEKRRFGKRVTLTQLPQEAS